MIDGLPLLLALFLVAWAAFYFWVTRPPNAGPRLPLPGERWSNKTLGIVEVVSVTPSGRIIRWTAALEDFGGGGPGLVVWTYPLLGVRVIASGPGLCTVEVNGGSVTHRLCVLDALRDAAPGST